MVNATQYANFSELQDTKGLSFGAAGVTQLFESVSKINTEIAGKLASFKEDNTVDNNGDDIATTFLARTLYIAAYEKASELFELTIVDNKISGQGGVAYKYPIKEPAAAFQIAEGSQFNYANDQTRSLIVDPIKIGIGTKISWELMKRGMDGFMQVLMADAAEAIMRKVGGDIVNGLAAGAFHSTSIDGDHSGSWATAVQNMKGRIADDRSSVTGEPLGFVPNCMVMNHTEYANFIDSADVKTQINPWQFNNMGNVNTNAVMYAELKVYKTPLLTHTGTRAIILSNRMTSVFVKESDMEVLEGRLPGTPDREILQIMSYGFGILFSRGIGVLQ